MKLPSWGLQVGGMLVAVVAGILIGKGMGSGSDEGSASSRDGNPPPRLRERSANADSGLEARPSREGRPSGSMQAGDRDQLASDLASILGTTGRLQRTQKLLNYLDRLPDGEFAGVYEQIKNDPGAALHNSERSMVLQAWAQRDPYAATDYLQANGALDWERETVLSSWATADPEAAFSWAKDAADEGTVNNWLVGTLKGAAAADPQLARDFLQRLDEGRTRREALGDIQSYITQFGYDYAEAWISGIGDQGLKTEASKRLADNLTELDPLKAANWNMSIEDRETRRDVSETVADRWARRDLESAMTWVESLPEDTRTEAAEGVARQYARQDPAAGADWLASLGDNPDLDGAKRVFIDEAFSRDPAVSLGFVSNLADERSREKSYYRYLGTWMKSDPQGARTWTEANATVVPQKLATRILR